MACKSEVIADTSNKGDKVIDPILTPNQWHDLCAEIGRLVTRDGLFNVREALDTFKVNQKPR